MLSKFFCYMTASRYLLVTFVSWGIFVVEVHSQVRIRTRVEISPRIELSQSLAPPVTSAGTIVYRASFSGGVRTDRSRIASFFADPCLSRQDAIFGGSVEFSAPAQGGVISARVLFSPAATGAMVQTWAVDGVVFRKDSANITCTNCTLNLLPELRLYPGFILTQNFSDVMHGESIDGPFSLDPIDRLDFCQSPVWSPFFGTTFRITSGARYGQFIDAAGKPLGTTITCTAEELTSIRYLADGDEPDSAFGTVTVEVSSAGIIRTSSFQVRNQELSVIATPSVIAQGQTSVLTVRRRMLDGTTTDLGPNNYVYFFNESSRPAGNLISADGSQRDPYYVEGDLGRASFEATVDPSQPDSFRVSISVGANEGTGRVNILVVRNLPAGHAPVIDRVATSTGETVVGIGSPFTLVGEFHDADNDVVTAGWSGPGIGGGPATRVISLTPPGESGGLHAMVISPISATATLSDEGFATFVFFVTDAQSNSVSQQLSVAAFPECHDVTTITITPYLQDDNLDCSLVGESIPGGSTYADFPSQLGTDAIKVGACYDRTGRRIRLQLKSFELRMVYGVCKNNLDLAKIALIQSASEITTQDQACALLAEGSARTLELNDARRQNLQLRQSTFLFREELLTHEFRHVQLSERHLREAVSNIAQNIQDESVSVEEATRINMDMMYMAAKANTFGNRIEDRYRLLGKRWRRRDELDAQTHQAGTLKILLQGIRERFPDCQ